MRRHALSPTPDRAPAYHAARSVLYGHATVTFFLLAVAARARPDRQVQGDTKND